jgi:hypothetical protein
MNNLRSQCASYRYNMFAGGWRVVYRLEYDAPSALKPASERHSTSSYIRLWSMHSLLSVMSIILRTL